MTDPSRYAAEPARPRIVDFALRRLRASRVLQLCGAAAFIDYGGLIVLALKSRYDGAKWIPLVPAWLALFMALMSIASWYFMFGWYPFLESLIGPGTMEGRSKAVGHILESLAIGCVAVVHAMLTAVLIGVVTEHLKFA